MFDWWLLLMMSPAWRRRYQSERELRAAIGDDLHGVDLVDIGGEG